MPASANEPSVRAHPVLGGVALTMPSTLACRRPAVNRTVDSQHCPIRSGLACGPWFWWDSQAQEDCPWDVEGLEEVRRSERIERPLGGDFHLVKTGDFETAIDIGDLEPRGGSNHGSSGRGMRFIAATHADTARSAAPES